MRSNKILKTIGKVIKDYILMRLKIFVIGIVTLIILFVTLLFLAELKIPDEYMIFLSIFLFFVILFLVSKLFKVKHFPPIYGVELEFYQKYKLGKIYNAIISTAFIIIGIYLIMNTLTIKIETEDIFLKFFANIFLPIFGIFLIVIGIYLLVIISRQILNEIRKSSVYLLKENYY